MFPQAGDGIRREGGKCAPTLTLRSVGFGSDVLRLQLRFIEGKERRDEGLRKLKMGDRGKGRRRGVWLGENTASRV